MYHSMSMEQKHCSITSCNSFSSLQKVIAFHLAFSFSSCANLSIHAFAVAFMSLPFMSFHFFVARPLVGQVFKSSLESVAHGRSSIGAQKHDS